MGVYIKCVLYKKSAMYFVVRMNINDATRMYQNIRV